MIESLIGVTASEGPEWDAPLLIAPKTRER